MATPFRHRDETLTFFVFIQVNEALIHCRVVVTKLKKCPALIKNSLWISAENKKNVKKIRENLYMKTVLCVKLFDVFLCDLL